MTNDSVCTHMTAEQTAVLFPTKLSSDDGSEFSHSSGAEASLALTQSTPVIPHDTTTLCWFYVTLWNCHIYADAIRA